jgi:hypothetical protein
MTAVGIFRISRRPELAMRATVDTRLIGRLGARTERSEHDNAYGMRDVHHAFSPHECASIFFGRCVSTIFLKVESVNTKQGGASIDATGRSQTDTKRKDLRHHFFRQMKCSVHYDAVQHRKMPMEILFSSSPGTVVGRTTSLPLA